MEDPKALYSVLSVLIYLSPYKKKERFNTLCIMIIYAFRIQGSTAELKE